MTASTRQSNAYFTFTTKKGDVILMTDELNKNLDTISISPYLPPEEIEIRLTIFKADREERHRQQVLERAERAWNSVNNVACARYPTQLSFSEFESKVRKLPPKRIKQEIAQLELKIDQYTRQFPALFEAKMEDVLPCNWKNFFAKKDAAIADKKRQYKDMPEAIEEAVTYLKVMISAAEAILHEKEAFIEKHAGEIPDLIKKGNKLRQSAARLRNQISKMLLDLLKLKEKETARLVSLILQHRALERENDVISSRLAQFNPDDPSCGLTIFPSSYYILPGWLRVNVEQAEREATKK
jgi:hypothetical protein